MLLGTLGASLSGNLLSGKGIVRAGYGHLSKKEKGIIRAGYGHPSSSASQKTMEFLIPLHPLTNLQKYRNIMRINQDLLEIFQEIIYLKK